MELMEHQQDAVDKMHNGCVLYGGVGLGKTCTALAYYVQHEAARNLVVITTARKRDELDWEFEAAKFHVFPEYEHSKYGTITVDSWNNIGKYLDAEDAFFIFDEQRVVGRGAWVEAFLKITKRNRWILLSATPGDTWMDYASIFIANGFFKNITEFRQKHVLFEPFTKYPKVKGYINERKLELLRNEVLVEMPYVRSTRRVMNWIDVDHDVESYNYVWKHRWNILEEAPAKDIAELFRVLRYITNTDPSRLEFIYQLLGAHNRIIIFYNFNYELDILRLLDSEIPVYEWNGHQKDPLPTTDRWVYLVQYVAGAEAWNCTTADAMVFYSLTYSYKNFEQAQGRIDRLNTPFEQLYYYMLVSNSTIDRGIRKALKAKKNFNERNLAKSTGLTQDFESGWDE